MWREWPFDGQPVHGPRRAIEPAGREGTAMAVIGRRSVLAGVGHFAPEEVPDQVGDLLVGWLAG